MGSEDISVVELEDSGDQQGARRREGWVPDSSQEFSSKYWMTSLEDKWGGGDFERKLKPSEFDMTVGQMDEMSVIELEI